MSEIKCPFCGSMCSEDTVFCGQCGTRVEPEKRIEPETSFVNSPQEKTFNKTVLYAVASVLAVFVLAIVVFISMFAAKENKYQEAFRLYNNAYSSANYYSDLSSAQSMFASLGGYKDSAVLVQDCESEIKYLDAMELIDQAHGAAEADKMNIYIRAKDVFYALGRYKNSQALAKECENNIRLIQSNEQYKKEIEQKGDNYYIIQSPNGDPLHGIGPFTPVDETSIADRNGDGYYKVMVGSADSKSAANNLRNELVERGFDRGSFVVYENGAYRVQVGAFDKTKTAQETIDKLRNAGYRDFIVR